MCFCEPDVDDAIGGREGEASPVAGHKADKHNYSANVADSSNIYPRIAVQNDNEKSVQTDLSYKHYIEVNVKSDVFNCNEKENSMQTELERKFLKLKQENEVLREEVVVLRNKLEKKFELSIDEVKDSDVKFRFYTGLNWLQFMQLWCFLGPAKDTMSCENTTAEASPPNKTCSNRKLAPINQLFLTLIRLRTGILETDLAFRFGITKSSVSDIVNTWIHSCTKNFQEFAMICLNQDMSWLVEFLNALTLSMPNNLAPANLYNA